MARVSPDWLHRVAAPRVGFPGTPAPLTPAPGGLILEQAAGKAASSSNTRPLHCARCGGGRHPPPQRRQPRRQQQPAQLLQHWGPGACWPRPPHVAKLLHTNVLRTGAHARTGRASCEPRAPCPPRHGVGRAATVRRPPCRQTACGSRSELTARCKRAAALTSAGRPLPIARVGCKPRATLLPGRNGCLCGQLRGSSLRDACDRGHGTAWQGGCAA